MKLNTTELSTPFFFEYFELSDVAELDNEDQGFSDARKLLPFILVFRLPFHPKSQAGSLEQNKISSQSYHDLVEGKWLVVRLDKRCWGINR